MQTPGTTHPDLLTSKQVADTLALSLRTITTKRWRVEHGLPGVKIGKSIRFRREDVQRIIVGGLERLPGEARR